MKKFSILFLMTALSLIAAALEKNYPLIQEKDVEISKYNSAFSTSLSSVQDPESGRDVLKITYAVKPGTRKNVNLNLSFPALQADQWQTISKISVKLRGGLGHCNVLLIDRDGETFAQKGIRMIGSSSWKNYDFHFNELTSPNYTSWGGRNKRNGKLDAPVRISLQITIYPSYIASQLRGSMILNSTKPTDAELEQGMKPVDLFLSDLVVSGVLPGKEIDTSSRGTALPVEMNFAEIGTSVPLKPGHRETLKCSMKNLTGNRLTLQLHAVSNLALTEKAETHSREVTLKENETLSFELPFRFQEKGVHNVRLKLTDGNRQLESKTFVNVWEPVGNHWDDSPETFFGTQAALDLFSREFAKYREQDYQNMRDAGVKLLRFTIRWSAIQPRKEGPLKWAPYDQIVKKCREYGIIPYLMISNAPSWSAAEKNSGKTAPRFVMGYAPDNMLYAEFVGKVAERYKDYTNYLQIWNEPYANQYYWGGNAKTYADMLRKAGAVAKEKNPSAKICAGAAWDEVFFSARGSYDFWPFHCHSEVGTLHELIRKYRKMAREVNMPLSHFWCDETGFAVSPFEEGAELVKAGEIVKKGVVSRAAGLGSHVWFVYRGSPKSPTNPRDNYPAIDEKNRCRPVVLAHNTMATHLKQTRLEKAYYTPGVAEGYVFRRPGERVIAIWRAQFPKGQITSIQFDQPVQVRFSNLLGTDRVENISTGKLTLFLTREPQWLIIPDKVQVQSIQYQSILKIPEQQIVHSGEKTRTLPFTVNNPLFQPFSGRMEFSGADGWSPEKASIPIQIPEGGTFSGTITFRAAGSVPPLAYPGFRLVEPAQNISISNLIKFVNCMRLPRTETLLADLSTKQSMLELRRGDVDSDMFWQGPEDLSARIYGGWDRDALKLKVVVRDDKHFQAQEKGGLFEGDSVQIEVRVDGKRYQIGLARTNSGTLTFHQWRGESAVPVKYDVKREGNITTYLAAVPWKNLGIAAQAGQEFQLSILVNDNDGRFRKVLLEWGGGIHGMVSHPLNPIVLE